MKHHSLNLARPRDLTVEEIAPQTSRQPSRGLWVFDFGRAAFGTVRLTVTATRKTAAVLHLGEKMNAGGRIDRNPEGCVRYRAIRLELQSGTQTLQVEIPPDQRNTGPGAILMPPELFEVMPFRYAELDVENTDAVSACNAVQLAVFYPFDNSAAEFRCNDERLNQVWDLCKYSIKATSFCGVYVDGDRERIPYEADAYINQLCHYGVDAEYELARHTFEHLLFHPTWPTEWALHFLPMAWADWQYTGRTDLLETYYENLQSKALLPLAREDGLISTETGLVTPELMKNLFLDPAGSPMADLIDWPPGSFTEGGQGERDSYDMVPVKTVINAFHIWNINLLSQIAARLNKPKDAAFYRERTRQAVESFHRSFFNQERGVFIDGEGSDHSSLHANMMPAAFGLIPPGKEKSVLEFIKSRGMACSVYGAQYLLAACYRLGDAEYALNLMTAEHDRGWLNMLKSGSTVTMEAWDWKYKNNLDWNHAWGAAPANIIPRRLMGVRPLTPGFGQILLNPQPGCLTSAELVAPTIKGPVRMQIEQNSPEKFVMNVDLPENTTARVLVPSRSESDSLTIDGKTVRAVREEGFIGFDELPGGKHTVVRA